MNRMTIVLVAGPALAVIALLATAIFTHRKGEGRSIARKVGLPYVAIMAHRGLSELAPEESDPAYRLALEMGADYLEADIQRTADGVLVCIHDDTPARTTDVASVFPGRENNTIDTFTYAELLTLDTGSWFNAKNPDRARDSFHALKILTLEELIDIAESSENRPGLYLETKSAHRYPGIEKQILDLLRSRGWVDTAADAGSPSEEGSDDVDLDNTAGPNAGENDSAAVAVADTPGRVVLQSFEEDSIALMRKLAPRVPRVYLVDEDMEKDKGGWDRLVSIARRHEAHLGPSGYQAWPWRTAAAHQRGVLVHHYTINNRWQMWLLRWFGTDGIFTNRADLALRLYRHRQVPGLEATFQRIGY